MSCCVRPGSTSLCSFAPPIRQLQNAGLQISLNSNSKWVLTEFWMSSGWVLNEFQMSSDWVLNEFWMSSEWVLNQFWMNSEWVLNEFWMSSDWVPNEFWMSSEWVLNQFWMSSEWVLNQFWVLNANDPAKDFQLSCRGAFLEPETKLISPPQHRIPRVF